MKKVLAAAGLFFCMTVSAHAAGDVKISGAVELQYMISSDKYETQGDDAIKFEELYIQIEAEVAENISGMIKLDAADMNEVGGGNKDHDSSMVEEAQIIFRNIAGQPLTVYVGKDEMPWIQDYEKFLFSSEVHGKEVDKVIGVHGQYKIDGFGSVDLAFFERDSDNKPADKYETGLTDSMTVKLTADKLVDNLSLSLGYKKEGKDKAALSTETDDATGTSIAAIYKVAGLTIHAEMLSMEDHDGASEEDIKQVGLDYKLGNFLLKGRYETVDADDGAGDDDTLTAYGVSYYFDKKAYMVIEHETDDPDAGDSVDTTMVGFNLKY
ncbi:MAG: porin [bacterium]|nr:porin [bacterium]